MERVVVALGGNALLRAGRTTRSRTCARRARRPRASPTSRRRGGRSWSPTATARRSAGSSCSRRREAMGAPDAARRVRRREPGADRVPAGSRSATSSSSVGWSAGRDGPHAHTGRSGRPGVREPRQADRTVLRGGRGEAARGRPGMGQADPHGGFRRVVPSPNPYSIVEAPDPNTGRRRHDRDRVGRVGSRGRGRPQADRPRGRGRQGPGRGDPRSRPRPC